MALKVLIVEDQFLEADSLSIILKNEGYEIRGIAKSVEEANKLIDKGKPDIVLVDVFLKGDLTGIDLARLLDKKNIPFIFLTANSNSITMEEALATNPSGFLIKPFREREILMTLNIAVYRHQKSIEFFTRQHLWLSQLLQEIKDMNGMRSEKMLAFVKALTSFFPFDFVVIDTDLANPDENAVYRYRRVGFDEYVRFDAGGNPGQYQLLWPDLVAIRKKNRGDRTPYYLNGEQFNGFRSKLWAPLLKHWDVDMSVTFYGCNDNIYSTEHIGLIVSVQALLAEVIDSIRKSEDDQDSPPKPRRIKRPGQLLKPELEGIIGKSPRLLEALDKIAQVAPFENTVLIMGETGVGKEGLVKALHQLSNRKSKPFVKVNCAAIPVNLLESELFGHEKGSFTGSVEKRIGKFELAHEGTLFLDEIGELPVEVQSKLLRAIQEKEIERVGGRTTIKTDVRIIAATNRNLLQEIADGNFRLDLYYRLNVFPITIAPLRERKEDIPALAKHFVKIFGLSSGGKEVTISESAMEQLYAYDWPGNIRELQHLIERHVLLAKRSVIDSFEMPEPLPMARFSLSSDSQIKSFDEMDKEHIICALRKCNGKIAGQGGAGELLKLRPTTLRSKMKRLGITWPVK
ncbi:sigma 54-interacting transcriptional regulator [Puia dinghuensis]|uniref:Fis family transcriptional regulator n=1 Tax=Puia dinghuensis TaxID=1792502 RepID=A0A8J2XR28_9BACT|nr:sigma 54-interacting transcriptional regulator [Puia dinghuensis]GGA97800.1 Fis family transcriptional regulator [Puia dinghuensis]